MFDSNFNLKIGDFGFSAPLSDDGLKTYLGTPNYMAPEIVYGIPYDGK